MTERSVSRDLPGLAQSLPQGRPGFQRADRGQKNLTGAGRVPVLFQVTVEQRG